MRKGSAFLAGAEWDGREDPLFKEALEVAEETLSQNRKFDWDLEPTVRLQMGSLLLWAAIERCLSLRYDLTDKVMAKVKRLGVEPAFAQALRSHLEVKEVRTVVAADDPGEKIVLSRDRPDRAVLYHDLVRCNAARRGKGVVTDHETVAKSLAELLPVFRDVLADAFNSSTLDQGNRAGSSRAGLVDV